MSSMMKLSLGLAVLGGIVLVACDPSAPSGNSKFPFPSNEKPSNGDNGGQSGSFSGGTAGSEGPAPDDLASCATRTATAEPKAVYLVFMFDKSGSMTESGSPKWNSAKDASKAFFESVESKGVNASLAFFPDKLAYSCDADAYRTPSVAMTSLPSSGFASSLDAQNPDGDTPTRAALGGAIAYAQALSTNEAKDGKVAIVLVTDGLPDSICDGNSVAAVSDLAASVKDTLPTYVIGVGDELDSLKDIALSGGTNDAFIVNATDPAKIKADFLTAINTIKTSAIACDYDIPPPPAGESLDRNKVNVVHTVGGTRDALPYNQSCNGGSGWRYDDANAPTRILLCDASCASVKTNPGETKFVFGCATRSAVLK